jgi:serine/threonine protein kinase
LYKSRDPEAPLLVADFGLAKIMDYDQIDALRTTCGTPGYIAPEVLDKVGHGKPCDMWSIGCMTYFLLVGYLPFEDPDHQIDYNRLRAGIFSFDEVDWKGISPQAKSFIQGLLVVDPRKRMTVSDALKHPWMFTVEPLKVDLLPRVQTGFSARKQFRKAFEALRAAQVFKNGSPPQTPTQ